MGEKRGRKNETQRLDELRGDQVWHRLAADAEALGLDSKIRTQIGRLVIKRQISPTQASAADLIGRIYGRYERLHRQKRSCRSPSYEFSTAGARERIEDEDWIEQTEADFKALERILKGQRHESETRNAVVALCAEDRMITGYQLTLIYPVLNEVSVEFGLGPAEATTATPLARTRSKPRLTRQARLTADEYSAHTADTMPATDLAARQKRRERTIGQILERDAARDGLDRVLRVEHAEP